MKPAGAGSGQLVLAGVWTHPPGQGIWHGLVDPPFLRGLSPEAGQELHGIQVEMHRGVLPMQARMVRVALPSKPSGGERPISVLSNMYRSAVSTQRTPLRAWEARAHSSWDYATRGQGAVAGAFDTELKLEVLRHQGFSVCGALLT